MSRKLAMRTLTVPIAGLLLAILGAAVGLAALRSASPLWASVAYSTALATLGVAILGTALGRKHTREFWLGFLVFGLGYFHASLGWDGEAGAWSRWGNPFGTNPNSHPALITTKLLEVLHGYASSGWAPRVGASVQVQWGSARTLFPATILEVPPQPDQFKVRYTGYDSSFDEWVGANRIQSAGPAAFIQVGHCLLTPWFGLFGGLLAVLLFARSRPGEPEGSSRATGA
jgi:hypothetical protein